MLPTLRGRPGRPGTCGVSVVFEVGTVASRGLAVPDPDVAWFEVDADVDCELLVAPKRVRVLPRRRSGTIAML